MKFILTLAIVSCFVLIASALPKLNTTAFINEALAAHNKYRKLHNAAPLKINEDLNLLAQSIANIKAIDESYTSHLPKYLNQEIGINVAQTVENPKSKFGSGNAASESWYNGAIDYVMGVKNINSDDFAQLVWKGTKQVSLSLHITIKKILNEFFIGWFWCCQVKGQGTLCCRGHILSKRKY